MVDGSFSPHLDLETVEASPGKRLDVFVAEQLGRSRGYAQSLIKAGKVQVHPVPSRLLASTRLREGDQVTIQREAEEPVLPALEAEPLPLDILDEDDDLLVLNKAPGMVVHPAAGHASGTLVNALLHHCGASLSGQGGPERLGIVHRLDKDTSGLMVVAKTNLAHERLAVLFQERRVFKEYAALAKGAWRKIEIRCEEPIGRHPIHRKKMAVRVDGRTARTDFRVERQWQGASLVACRLFTGRTHQIRVHLSHLGHPILGDHVYGRAANISGVQLPPRQLLHARTLGFEHPTTGKDLLFHAPLPDDFRATVAQLDEVAMSSG